jgi:hypothetical protein
MAGLSLFSQVVTTLDGTGTIPAAGTIKKHPYASKEKMP